MPLLHIGAVLLMLLIVFVIGSVWFHFVETILKRVKKLFSKDEKTVNWHTLPPKE